MIGIYKITSPSGKVYIGQSIDIEKRWKQHQSKSRQATCKLYTSFKKYGVENHIFEVVEQCLREELNSKERYYQDKFNVLEEGLNHILQESNEVPKILSEETKRKISEAHKGKKLPEGTKRKISERATPEIRAEISKRMTGRKLSEETKRKMSEASIGRKHTLEVRKAMSERSKGRTFSEETRRKISETLSGRTTGRRGEKQSEETKRKISEKLTGRKQSEETKRKRSESVKRSWALRKEKKKL